MRRPDADASGATSPEGRVDSPSPFGSRLLGPTDQSPGALRRRVQLLLTSTLVTTNVVGAIVVVVLSTFVVTVPDPTPAVVLALAIAIPSYVVAATLVGSLVGTRVGLRALVWTREGVEPTDEQRAMSLRVPMRLTQMQAVLWTGAVVLFGAISIVLQPSRTVSTSLTVGIAGLVVCTIAYLLSEFTLRPVAARALAGDWAPRDSLGVARRMLVFWMLGTGAPVVGLLVQGVLVLTGAEESVHQLAVLAISLGGIVLVFGFFVTVLNARAVIAPILSVRRALAAVEEGDLDVEVTVYDGTELGLLQSGFNQMAAGLREREHLRDVFGRHVGHHVARAAVSGGIELGGELRPATVLFVDLVASTAYAAARSPTEVVETLNRFFEVVVSEVDEHGGFVNKFMGDAALAVFGVPTELDDHAGRALRAARTIAARLAAEVTEVRAGIGVVTGEVVAGNVGASSRFEYTVIGDAVNAAARVTELAKDLPGGVASTWPTVTAAAHEQDRWRPGGTVTLRGRPEETELAVLLDAGSSPAPGSLAGSAAGSAAGSVPGSAVAQ